MPSFSGIASKEAGRILRAPCSEAWALLDAYKQGLTRYTLRRRKFARRILKRTETVVKGRCSRLTKPRLQNRPGTRPRKSTGEVISDFELIMLATKILTEKQMNSLTRKFLELDDE